MGDSPKITTPGTGIDLISAFFHFPLMHRIWIATGIYRIAGKFGEH